VFGRWESNDYWQRFGFAAKEPLRGLVFYQCSGVLLGNGGNYHSLPLAGPTLVIVDCGWKVNFIAKNVPLACFFVSF
jgi:hypothetical protein